MEMDRRKPAPVKQQDERRCAEKESREVTQTKERQGERETSG